MPKAWGENPRAVTLTARSASPFYSLRDPDGDGLTSLPGYMSGMAMMESRKLTTAYAPADGVETLQQFVDQLPAPYNDWGSTSGDPGVEGLSAVINDWAGGAPDTAGKRVFVCGGGHSGSANNGVYTYTFAGDTAPGGWALEPNTLSLITDVPRDSGTAYEYYNDGLPASRHTYDGMAYDPVNGRVVTMGGAPWRLGIGTVFRGYYDRATDSWTSPVDYSGALVPNLCLDENTGKFLFYGRASNSIYLHRPDGTKKTLSISTQTPNNSSEYHVLVEDTSRNKVYMIGDGVNKRFDVDWTAETITEPGVFFPSGATRILDRRAPYCFYDAYEDCFWLYGTFPGDTEGDWLSVFQMDAVSLHIQEFTITGDIPTTHSGNQGQYKRAVFIPQWGALGIITHHNEAPHIVRLRTV